jgi:hypothetical protein
MDLVDIDKSGKVSYTGNQILFNQKEFIIAAMNKEKLLSVTKM